MHIVPPVAEAQAFGDCADHPVQ